MRICCLIDSLRCGGAERVMSVLADHWAGSGHQVWLVTFALESDDFYHVSASVNRVSLDLGDAPSSLAGWVIGRWRRVMAVRRMLRRAAPDVLVSFLPVPNIVAIAAAAGTGIPVVISERMYPPGATLAGATGRAWTWAR